jgi:hypothetical protein
MKKKTISVFELVTNRLNSDDFKSRNRWSDHDFCRERLLNFSTVMVIILNNISKSLSVELSNFFTQMRKGLSVSKQAFSKARYKIKAAGFIELNDVFVKAYYEGGDYQLYKGTYLLLATDGSDYELPYEASLIEAFGAADNKVGKQPICMAKGVKIWDLQNQLTVSSVLGHYDIAEIVHFKTAWADAKKLLSTRKEGRLLLLADMHYPSFWLIYDLFKTDVDFVFRCPPTFCREIKAFMAGDDNDKVLTIPIGLDTYRKSRFKRQMGAENMIDAIRVRAVKYTRPTGEQTCLITSIAVEKLTYYDIVDLYPYRWGEEVSYYFDKYRVEIENFSAKMPEGIRQDWYANTLNTNLAQLIVQDAQQILDEELKGKNNKYDYHINRSVALGIIKDEMPKMLFGKEKPITFYNRMIQLIIKHREPVRPNRSYPRIRKHKLKFSMNLRRVI